MHTADAEVRIQSAQSSQPPAAAAAVSDNPILPKSPVPRQDSRPDMVAQPATSAAAPQPSRFASEAAQRADISSSEGNGPNPGQSDEARQKPKEEEPPAALVKEPSDALDREAEQANTPAQQQSSDLRQTGGVGAGAGRIPDQPQGLGQGSMEQPQDGNFDNGLAPSLSGVKQVLLALPISPAPRPSRRPSPPSHPGLLLCYSQQGCTKRLCSVASKAYTHSMPV